MKELSIKESKESYAGGLSAGVCAIVAAGVSFLAGILDGLTRPFRCR